MYEICDLNQVFPLRLIRVHFLIVQAEVALA
jgi:hypothetical protein